MTITQPPVIVRRVPHHDRRDELAIFNSVGDIQASAKVFSLVTPSIRRSGHWSASGHRDHAVRCDTAATLPTDSSTISVGVCVLPRTERVTWQVRHFSFPGARLHLHCSGNCGQLSRDLMAAYRRTRIVKDFLESIREAGVALVEDGGIPGRDLQAAVSRALADLLAGPLPYRWPS